MLNMSLARKSSENTSQSRPLEERADGPSGLGRCTHAAIGFGYDGRYYLFTVDIWGLITLM